MSQDRSKPWAGERLAARTTFGRQALSTSASAPAFGFGSAVRTTSAREGGAPPSPPTAGAPPPDGKHAPARRAASPAYGFSRAERFPAGKELTPGPSGAIGAASPPPSAPGVQRGFGKSARDVADKLFALEVGLSFLHGRQSPGPAYVRGPDAIGKQGTSRRKTAPAFGFGTADRFRHAHVARARTTPGPGAYNVEHGTIGDEVAGSSELRTTFARSTRASAAKLFLGEAHSRRGLDSPGPQTHGRLYPLGSIGELPRQAAARKGLRAALAARSDSARSAPSAARQGRARTPGSDDDGQVGASLPLSVARSVSSGSPAAARSPAAASEIILAYVTRNA